MQPQEEGEAMGSDRLAALADELLAARRDARFLALPSSRAEGLSLVEAYAVADTIRTRRIADGDLPRGYKIGFTNRSIWPRYGVHTPIWAPVWDSTLTLLQGAETTLSLAGLVQPRLEPEIVFGFAKAPRAGMPLAELAACIAWVAHGFEVVDTHYEAWKFQAADTVADFALHGRLLVGPRVPAAQFVDLAAELAGVHLQLDCDGAEVDAGSGSAVLDGPLQALKVWVDAMAAQAQQWPICAGDVVTTGTLTDAWPLGAGQCWSTRLSDARLAGLVLRVQV
jgi:2-oxo-3-hexenedioate decarboxylase